MKRLLRVFLLTLLASLCLTAFASADVSGECGDNLTWTFNSQTGEVTISGEGAMDNWDALPGSLSPWFGSTGIRAVSVEEGVTSVGSYAFYAVKGLTRATLPDSITAIYSRAFDNCHDLTEIHIPDSVTYIGDIAFNYCKTLKTVTIPDSVTNLGSTAFQNCTSLQSVHVGSGIRSIYESTFAKCSSLTEITLPQALTFIGPDAFARCTALTTVRYAGSEEQWQAITIREGNESLLNAEILFNCGDASAPIGGEAGSGVVWTYENNTLTISGEGAMDHWNTHDLPPWHEFKESIHTVIIEEGVAFIGDAAFYQHTALRDVTVSDSVARIGNRAFEGCTSLSAVTLGSGVETIGDRAFQGCSSLAVMDLGSSVETIGEYAFYRCSSLADIDLGSSVETIGKSAFSGCKTLTKITIPDSVPSIPEHTFSDCAALKTVHLGRSVESIGLFAFTNAPQVHFTVAEGNPHFKAENGILLTADGKTLVLCPAGKASGSFALPAGIVSIGKYALSGCNTMIGITIPASVTSIGTGAFSSCTALVAVALGDSMKTIGDAAFSGCTSLASVTLGYGVETISPSAFSGCTALTKITIPDSVISIGNNAFSYCTALAEIALPDSITKIEDGTFHFCNSLTEIIIPDSVTSIDQNAFSNCTALTKIVIPVSVTFISSSFQYSENITTVCYAGSEEQWKAIAGNTSQLTNVPNLHFDCGKCTDGSSAPDVPVSGEYAAVNPRVENGVLFWDIPEALESRGNFTFLIEMLTKDGKWISLGTSDFGTSSLYLSDAGTYTAVRIRTQDATSGADLAEVQMDVDVTILHQQRHGSVSFSWSGPVTTKWGYDVYEVTLGGLTPNTEAEFALRTPSGNRHYYSSANSDENGFATVNVSANFSAAEECLTQGSFLVTEQEIFENDRGFLAIFTAVGDWAPCSGQETPNASLSGRISGATAGTTVTVGGENITVVTADGSFTVDAPSGTFDVVVKVPGALTYTVKDVTAEGGDITLPTIIPVKGDTNNDGMINIMDMGIFRQNFGKAGYGITNSYTDTNGDNMVNILDMSVFRTNFGMTNKDCVVNYQP